MKIYSTKLRTLGAIGAGTLLVGSLAAGTVFAQTAATEYPDIIQNLADTFQLDPAAVQEVFTTTRQQHREEKLDELVADGTITEEQKALIIAKQDELHTQMDAIRDNEELSEEDRRDQVKSLHEEFQTWAEENGIDLPMFGRPFERGGHGKRVMMLGE